MLPPRFLPPHFDPGSVWLVGAGPGDPGLLTLHAVHALGTADVVLHDALVSSEILAMATQARLEAAGKRADARGGPRIDTCDHHLGRHGGTERKRAFDGQVGEVQQSEGQEGSERHESENKAGLDRADECK